MTRMESPDRSGNMGLLDVVGASASAFLASRSFANEEKQHLPAESCTIASDCRSSLAQVENIQSNPIKIILDFLRGFCEAQVPGATG